MNIFTWGRFALLFFSLSALLLPVEWARGQTTVLFDSFTDGDFTANPVWGGETASWIMVANSTAAAGATGSNTLQLNGTGAATTYLSSQSTSSWGTSQEWGFWVGRRAQAFTAANQFYFWLYANESTLDNLTVDGYRIAIGDDAGGDNIRLEYIVNGAVSATVITSSGAITNGLTDIGFLIRVTRSATGAWTIYTSTLPTANGTGAIATDIPDATNASVNQGTATNNSLVPTTNGYLGVAGLHSSTGASTTIEFDQLYFSCPRLVIVNPSAVCLPSTIDITTTTVQTTNTGTTTNYYTTNALAVAGGAGDVTNPNALAISGTYYIRTELDNGCYIIEPVIITVDPTPSLTVVNPSAVCSPATVDITSPTVQTVNTGTTTKYYNSYGLALAGGASNVATPNAIASAGIYYIRAELASGCYAIQPVTVSINPSPTFAPLVIQPTCLTNGSIAFPEIAPGTYTYSYTINAGSAIPVSPSGGNITISVPMGVQTASTYAVTAVRTDMMPNCSYTVSINIAAIPFCVTPMAQVGDPCTCNNDQATDGSQTGTFNETVVVNGSGPGQIWTVKTIAPLVAGTAPALAVNTVLTAVINSAANGIDDDGDGSIDEPDEANVYSVSFVHTDDAGYTADIEGPAALGTGGNQTLTIFNRCQYPEIIFGANPTSTYCVTGAMPSVALSITEANGMAGTATFSGTGVSGATFAPTGGGTYAVTAVYQSTAGTGKGGTVGAPATAANVCVTTESKTTTVTDSRCGTFPQ